MAIRSWTIPLGAVLLAAFLFACAPETDRERYEVGESGVVTFHNQMRATLYLGGCGHFDYEQRIGDVWVSQGPDAICLWEGFAEAVPPGGVVTDPIHARAPGTWRLRYPVGFGCSESAPLGDGHCARNRRDHQQRVRSARRGLRRGRLLGPALRRRTAGQHLRVAPALRVLPRRPLRSLRAGGLLWLGADARTRRLPRSPRRRRSAEVDPVGRRADGADASGCTLRGLDAHPSTRRRTWSRSARLARQPPHLLVRRLPRPAADGLSRAARDQRRSRAAGSRLRHAPPRGHGDRHLRARGRARAPGQPRQRRDDRARRSAAHERRHRHRPQRVQPLARCARALPADLDPARAARSRTGLRATRLPARREPGRAAAGGVARRARRLGHRAPGRVAVRGPTRRRARASSTGSARAVMPGCKSRAGRST